LEGGADGRGGCRRGGREVGWADRGKGGGEIGGDGG